VNKCWYVKVHSCISLSKYCLLCANQAESSYLPYSVTRIGIEQELLVLLWKCLEEIPSFMPFILKHCDVTEILVLKYSPSKPLTPAIFMCPPLYG